MDKNEHRVSMRSITLFFFGIFLITFMNDGAYAQNNIIELSDRTDLLFSENRRIRITNQPTWFFRAGNNTEYASVEMDTAEWTRMPPRQLTNEFADKNGAIAGWFRTKIKADSTLANYPLYIDVVSHFSASEIYLDGKKIHSIGNTGMATTDFKKEDTFLKQNMAPLNLEIGKVHDLAIHFKIILPKFPLNLFVQNSDLYLLVAIAGTESREFFLIDQKWTILSYSLACAAFMLTFILFGLLSVYNPEEIAYRSIAIFNLVLFILMAIGLREYLVEISLTFWTVLILLRDYLIPAIAMYFLFLIGFQVSTGANPKKIKLIWFFYFALYFVLIVFSFIGIQSPAFNSFLALLLLVLTVAGVGYNIYKYWDQGRKSKKVIAAGLLITLFFIFFMIWIENVAPASIRRIDTIGYTSYSMLIFSYIFPVSLLFYVSLRIKEILSEVRFNAYKVVQIAEEKRELLANQNTILENQVKERTTELDNSLQHLKATQSQLIHSEKLASLGELTAGIAHEIQNPLNFVNNFSELSVDLVQELKEEVKKPEKNWELIEDLTDDLTSNQEKINHHGRRAASIVKSMLEHARTSTSTKEPTDLNALADEYLRLSYHGLRAKDSSFNAKMETDLDPMLGQVEVIPQDIGRVLLNLINNAFYATQQRKNQAPGDYEPTVSVSTRRLSGAEAPGSVEIRIQDNGTGIPDDVKAKIFQPFFTTKPTGQGTGLGLSLAYDIVTKGHGGALEVETREGEGTAFRILIPLG